MATRNVMRMYPETAALIAECEKCNNRIEIRLVWHPGGVNDYGGWVVQCDSCSHKQAIDIGRDVNDSRLVSGATKLDSWDRDVENRQDVLARHGLA